VGNWFHSAFRKSIRTHARGAPANGLGFWLRMRPRHTWQFNRIRIGLAEWRPSDNIRVHHEASG
jgi:hypothetical protein